jgi:signal transduction histidine kinase
MEDFNNLIESKQAELFFSKKDKEILALYEDYQLAKEKLRRVNSALLVAKEKAEGSELLKYVFLANMSREMWRPLNSMISLVDLLKEHEINDEDQQKYIGKIKKDAVNMLNIINGFIDIAKVESGQMEVLISTFNINEQIEYIYTFLKPVVEGKGMHLSFNNSLSSEAAILKTDQGKIFEIMVNLTKYAIKYCEKGTIEFGYNYNETLNPAELEFFVKDTGFDIPQNIRDAIYQYCDEDNIVDKRDILEAGLGFALSKGYVEALGSIIRVKSEEGKGSTYYFTIPYVSGSEAKVKNYYSS